MSFFEMLKGPMRVCVCVCVCVFTAACIKELWGVVVQLGAFWGITGRETERFAGWAGGGPRSLLPGNAHTHTHTHTHAHTHTHTHFFIGHIFILLTDCSARIYNGFDTNITTYTHPLNHPILCT